MNKKQVLSRGEWQTADTPYDWLAEHWSAYKLSRVESITVRVFDDHNHNTTSVPIRMAGSIARPPKRSRLRGYRIQAWVVDHSESISVALPPLHRSSDKGTWSPAKSRAPIAKTWPDDVLEAFSVVTMTNDLALMNAFAEEYAEGGCHLYPRNSAPNAPEMIGVMRVVELQDMNEQLVFILAHYMYLFLRYRNQIKGIRCEAFAGDYAFKTLKAYRER